MQFSRRRLTKKKTSIIRCSRNANNYIRFVRFWGQETNIDIRAAKTNCCHITSRCQSRVSKSILIRLVRLVSAIRLEETSPRFPQPDSFLNPIPDKRALLSPKSLYKNIIRPTLIPERRDYLFQLVFSRLLILFALKPKNPI